MLVRLEFPIATLDLNRCAFFLAELRETPALSCQALKQRRRLPVFTVLPVEFGDAFVNVFQADRIRVPHRTSAMGGETVAIEINDVDIRSAQREAFFKNACTFVDQSVHAAVHNFAGRYFALRDTGF